MRIPDTENLQSAVRCANAPSDGDEPAKRMGEVQLLLRALAP